MAFEDLTATVDSFLATAPGSEAIEFREVSDGSTGAWRSVRAFVLQGNEETDRVIGPRGGLGPQPIRIVLFKTEVPAVRVHKDQVRASGQVYTITSILSETSSSIELYCTF